MAVQSHSNTLRSAVCVALTLVLIYVSGCRGLDSAAGVSGRERTRMMAVDASAREDFRNGDLKAAEEKLKPIAEKPGVDQPLFKLDLASVYLMQGKKDKAFNELLAAHRAIAEHIDTENEKKAASILGKESTKYYKGDPYERATLYFLLALLFLEKGNPDNALASLKTGLLADSDTEKQTYKSDFALLQLLAAKCYELRGEADLRDQMLDAAFNSVVSFPGESRWFAENLVKGYNNANATHSVMRWLQPVLVKLCTLAKIESIEKVLMANGVKPEAASRVAKWAKERSEYFHPLDFNVLVLIWRGTPPEVGRVGRYGEKRVIREGYIEPGIDYKIIVDGSVEHTSLHGFGSINYQAVTRGGRKMDTVLSHQATFKSVTDTGANAVLISAGAVRQPIVSLSLLLAGLVMKVSAAVMHPEADIRYWGNLPHSIRIVPLKLSPGTHFLTLKRISDGKMEEVRTEKIDITDKTPLAAVFFHPLQSDADYDDAEDWYEQSGGSDDSKTHPEKKAAE